MLRVLGPTALDGGPGLTSRAQRVLLSALALDRASVVSADRLCELIWPDAAPVNPTGSLHNHVSRLRKLLPDGHRIEPAGSGYRLEVPDGMLDVERFEDLAARASAAERPQDALELIAAALALWRGRPYEDLDDLRADAESVRLSALYRALRERQARALVQCDRAGEALAVLEAQRRLDPLHEATTALFMEAAVRAGRRADALRAYDELRRTLAEQLGLEPSPALQQLELDVLNNGMTPPAQERSPQERSPQDQPPQDHRPQAPPSTGRPTTPTLPTSSLHGRQAELPRLVDALGRHRLVTVTGTGGVGKTRLARHAAAAAPQPERVLIELAVLRDSAHLDDLVASGLGARTGTGSSPLERIVATLERRPVLLILDNCEHVVRSAAELVEQLCCRCPSVTVLATSREPLNIDGEHVIRLTPLPVDGAATDLFLDRARAVRPDLELETDPLTPLLCRKLDGLPLALELAAGRLSTMSLAELAAGLDDRFALLTRGRRTADARHRSLRALVDWSVDTLDRDLRCRFAELSVFAGPFSATAAAAVCGVPSARMADELAELAERSLISPTTVTGGTRFTLLETLRLYGAELLRADQRTGELRDRHADWVLDLLHAADDADAADRRLPVPPELVAAELAEVRSAFRHLMDVGDGDRVLRLARELHHLALFAMQPEVFGWIAEAAERFAHLDHRHAERVVASASTGAWQSGDLAQAHRLADLAASIAARSRWPGAGAGAAEALADLAQFAGDHAAAHHHWQRAEVLARLEQPPTRLLTVLTDEAMVAAYCGQLDHADRALAEARAMVAEEGAGWLRAWVDYAEGEIVGERQPARAMIALIRAVENAARTGARFVEGVAGLTLIGLQLRAGAVTDLMPRVRHLIEHWRRGQAWVQLWITLRTASEALAVAGDLRTAAVVLGALEEAGAGAEAAGPDRRRLDALHQRVVAELPDAAEHLAAGAALEREALVELVLARLAVAEA